MVKVIWQQTAQDDLRDICFYYRYVKLAPKVAEKIKKTAFETVRILEKFPHSGTKEPSLAAEDIEFRYLVLLRHYKIIYFIDANVCHIVTVWDCRNNPHILENKLKS